jgi:hypothetical protein
MSKDESRPVAWNPEWPLETAELAYSEAREAAREADKWADVVDTKAVAVFTVAAGAVTLAPSLQRGASSPLQALLWLAALICFLGSAYYSYCAYKPHDFRFGPDPLRLQTPEWLALPPGRYRYRMLEWLGKNYEHNSGVTERKAKALTRAMRWTAFEVIALSLAVILPALT